MHSTYSERHKGAFNFLSGYWTTFNKVYIAKAKKIVCKEGTRIFFFFRQTTLQYSLAKNIVSRIDNLWTGK